MIVLFSVSPQLPIGAGVLCVLVMLLLCVAAAIHGYRTVRRRDEPQICPACGGSGLADYAAVPCPRCAGGGMIRQGEDNER